MNLRRHTPILAIALLTTLAGCGYKGPLTLPPKPGDVTVRPATPAPPGSTKPAQKQTKPATDATAPAPPGASDSTRG